jgi:hypothetical protein
MHEAFKKLIFDSDYSIGRSAKTSLSSALESCPFHARFGSTFAIALAFVVDSSLKRGQSQKATVKEHHIITLLSCLSERDIFLRHHQDFLFVRLATRSTIGLDYERSFLDSIAGVVTEDNLGQCRELLDDGREFAHENFYYRAFRHGLVGRIRTEGLVPIHPDYGRLSSIVDTILKREYPSRKYRWLHHLATAEVKISTGGGITHVTMSLAGLSVLGVIAKEERIAVGKLTAVANVASEWIVHVIHHFKVGGIITIEERCNNEEAVVVMNRGWAKQGKQKVVMAENWAPRPIAVQKITENRMQAAQAKIVMLMKRARMMRNQQLIEKTMEQTATLFPITMVDIRQAIQIAIGAGYIEQVDDEHLRYIE